MSDMDSPLTPRQVASNAAILKRMLEAIATWTTRAEGEPQAVRDRLAGTLGHAIGSMAYGTLPTPKVGEAPSTVAVGGLVGPEAVQIISVLMGPDGRPENWDPPPRTLHVSPGVAKVVMALLPTRLVHEAWRNEDGSVWIDDGVEVGSV